MILWQWIKRAGAILACFLLGHRPGKWTFITTNIVRNPGQVPVIEYMNRLHCGRCGTKLKDEHK